jgi:hypothetical protein
MDKASLNMFAKHSQSPDTRGVTINNKASHNGVPNHYADGDISQVEVELFFSIFSFLLVDVLDIGWR